MNNALETRYFLSAMTGAGYYALHRQFLRPPERYFCILKGGPGVGKSTFMRRVHAALCANGEPSTLYFCSGDPDSLDSVAVPHAGLLILDGTAPHIVDPEIPGARDSIINLGECLNEPAMRPRLPHIRACMGDHAACSRRARACLAAAAALTEAGIKADKAAGFSLGEIGALTYTGAVDLETGFHLVCRRGELMQAAAEEQPTAMAAVLKLPNEKVEELCGQFPETYPVNYNCPGQVSVACAKEQLAPFSAAVKAAGGRALPLKVRGGFHSPFMASAAEGFAQVLADCQVEEPKIPLYSNRTGAVYSGNAKELLAQQIASPVRWEAIVRDMIAAGVDTFIELGPGSTLCGLIQKIDKTVKTYPLATKEDLEKVVQEVKA